MTSAPLCGSCTSPVAATWRCCVRCGAVVHGDVAPAERRVHATVVVSDLQGSTALAERLDPESLRLVLDQYFDELGRVLESFSGRIEKRVGDAIVTVFGVEQGDGAAVAAAHAVAETQATLARLNDRLEQSSGVRLVNRTGIATGEVVVTDAGGGHRVIAGQAFERASALEPVSPPFEALLDITTVHELDGSVAVGDGIDTLLRTGERVVAHRLDAVIGRDEQQRTDAIGDRLCPSCGSPPADVEPPPERCFACGTRFADESHRINRRTVTIVFADLRANGPSDDAVRSARLRCFDEVRVVLERHGAVVEKFIGDAVMAVFGLDRRREDDSLRAARAGLDIQRRMGELGLELATGGVAVDARIGINTGAVIAGDPARGQRLVTGDAVNVAARLEQAAGPGEVLLGASTKHLCGRAVQVEDLAPLPLKGKAVPVAASRLMAVDSGSLSQTGQPLVPMLGRGEEFDALTHEIDQALSTRGLRRVIVHGDAGSGKSRLVNETLDRFQGRVRLVRTLCPAYGDGLTFWPVIEMLRELLDIEPDGRRDVALAQLHGAVNDADVSDRLAALLGLIDAPYPLGELFWGVRRAVEAAAARVPLVLVIDGFHRAEATLHEMFDYVASHLSGASMVVVAMARPDDDEDADGLAGWHHLTVDPLDDDTTTSLLALHLGGDLPPVARDQIVRVSGGNPLFVEQIAAMLVDDPRLRRSGDRWVMIGDSDTFVVPPTIEAILAARFDALSVAERNVVEPASIVGREFARAAVAAIGDDTADLDESLRLLAQRRLVLPARDTDVLVDHRFANAMLRDVAYEGLLKRTRAVWHEIVADWIGSAVGERSSEYAELIGFHLEQAYRYQRELGAKGDAVEELGRRAFSFLGPAGERAFVRGDMPAASSLLGRAASTLPDADPERNRALIRAGEARMQTGDFETAIANFTAAEEHATAAGDVVTAASALLARSTLQYQIGGGVDDVAARDLASRLTPIFTQGEDFASLARCARLLAYVDLTSSQWGAAERSMTDLIAHARRAGDTVLELRALPGLIGFALHGPTPVKDAIAKAEALAPATASDRRARALTDRYLGQLLALDGRGDEGRQRCLDARETLVSLGWHFEAALVSIDLGPIELMLGRPDAAESALRADFDDLRAMGERNYIATTAALLAEAVFRQGRIEESIELIAFCENATSPTDTLTQAVVRQTKARGLAALGDLVEAERLAREALDMVLGTDGLTSHGDALLTVAQVLAGQRRPDEAMAMAKRSGDCYRVKGHLPGQRDVERILAALAG